MSRSKGDLAGRIHHVYVISNAAGECIYVGMTCNLKRRLAEHARLRMWRQPRFQIAAHCVADRSAAEALECRLIRELSPTQNRYSTSREHGKPVRDPVVQVLDNAVAKVGQDFPSLGALVRAGWTGAA